MTKIGVFDSGIGGESVAASVRQALPDAEIVVRSDQEHMPYGNKSPKQILGFVVPILEDLVTQGCGVIVIACNTATTTLIGQLRERIKVPLVGIEPMIKPATEFTKTGVIAVCATPATLASERYGWLKNNYAKGVKVLEPDCSEWAYMIEHNKVNEHLIEKQIKEVCGAGADVIVLGCTHYHWIEDTIQGIVADRAKVIQPDQAVVRQLKKVLGQHS